MPWGVVAAVVAGYAAHENQANAQDAQQAALDQSNSFQLDQYNQNLARHEGGIRLANESTDALRALMHGDYSGFEKYKKGAGYEAALTRGTGVIGANAAVNGGVNSGARRKAEIAYAGNLDKASYNDYFNTLQRNAGLGGGAIDSADRASQVYGGNVGQNILQQGNINASAYQQQGQLYNDILQAGAYGAGRYFGPIGGSPAQPTQYDVGTAGSGWNPSQNNEWVYG